MWKHSSTGLIENIFFSFAKLSIIIKYNTKVGEIVYDINAWSSEIKLGIFSNFSSWEYYYFFFAGSLLIFNFHILQYNYIVSNDIWSSVGDSARITVSSAYTIMYILIYS